MRPLLLTAAFVLLAACSTAPSEELPPPQLPQRAGVDPVVAARAEGIEFRAVGDGFVLDIFRAERIRLRLTETDTTLEFPRPEPRYPRWNGTIFDTAGDAGELYIEIRDDRPCSTGSPTVNVRLASRSFTGCGRSF